MFPWYAFDDVYINDAYTAYETFDNEVDRDRRTQELMSYKDKEIVCTNEDNNNMYILKYTIAK